MTQLCPWVIAGVLFLGKEFCAFVGSTFGDDVVEIITELGTVLHGEVTCRMNGHRLSISASCAFTSLSPAACCFHACLNSETEVVGAAFGVPFGKFSEVEGVEVAFDVAFDTFSEFNDDERASLSTSFWVRR